MADAAFKLSIGNDFPFDATDAWHDSDNRKPPAPKDWAHAAARGVLADLQDRRGIKHGFDDIDQDTRKEIVKSLASIIRLAHQRQSLV